MYPMPRDTSFSSTQSAIVAGAGFGGIAAALRLRAKGYDVHLIDRCPRLGGRGQVFEKDGFCHDAGPTVLTAPHLFEELFALFGKKMSDYVTLVVPDPWYRFQYHDGDTFDYGPTDAATEAEIARISPDDVAGYRRMAAWSKSPI
jgi:phytoene desaturase